jgi:hypothetical protein
MFRIESTLSPHSLLAIRVLLIASGLALLTTIVAAQPLPPHGQHHPRLFFDAAGAADLMATINSDPRRAEVWEDSQDTAAHIMSWPPEELLSSYFGYHYIEELSLMSSLEEEPLATVHARTVIDALLWQIDEYDTEPDDFLSVLAVALRLHNLAWGWDLACWAASEAERQIIADEMLLYMSALSTEWEFVRYQHNPYVSNKGISLGAMLWLAAMALEADLPDAPEIGLAREAAASYLDKGLGDLLTPEGCYREGLGYFVWAMRTLMPSWAAAERNEAERPWSDEQLQAVLEAMAYQMMDEGGGLYLNRNDHNSLNYIVGRHHSLMEFATTYGADPDFARWLLRRSSGDLGHPWGHINDPTATLLWHVSGPETGPEHLPPGRHFETAGFWVYRESWPGDPVRDRFLLSLEAAEFKGGHAQEDVGQIILRAMGHGFALDNGAGVTAKETAAHNLPLIGGRGQHNAGASIGTDGTLRRFIAGPRWQALRADMTDAYTTHSPFNDADWPIDGIDWSWGYDGGNPMQRAWRELLLLPGGPGELPEIWLRDRLVRDSSVGEGMQWRLHLDQDLALGSTGPGAWLAAGTNGRLNMLLHSPDPALVSSSFSLFDNDGVDPDSRVLALDLDADAADFLWQWTPLRPGEPDPETYTERFPAGLRSIGSRGGRERKLLIAHDDVGFAVEGDTLIADWGLIEREGPVLRHLLIEGTRLVENGRLLTELSGRGTVGWEGDTLRMSGRGWDFRVWAPGAQAVLVDGEPVYFSREGEYVLGPASEPPDDLPASFSLRAPWPNPGQAPLSFQVWLPRSGHVELSIYDLRGRRLYRIDSYLAAGNPTITWDGCDEAGNPVAAGLYLVRAEYGPQSRNRKFVLLAN